MGVVRKLATKCPKIREVIFNVSGAKWVRSVYKTIHRSIRDHMDNDVKKLGLSMMFVDVSYKAAKKIRNINLQPIVNGIVTIMNQCNEIRSQMFCTN